MGNGGSTRPFAGNGKRAGLFFGQRPRPSKKPRGHLKCPPFKKTSALSGGALYYNKGLSEIKDIENLPYKYTLNHAYHLYIIRIKKQYGLSRDKLHEKLFKSGIKTTVHYKPLHTFSIFKKEYRHKDFPNTMKAFKECLTLPLFPTITRKQQDYVLSNLKKFQN